MSADQKVAPVIIKRKKIVQGDGHHGGAWKVAYADFVTAMMAFFMLMWLLNATTEQQRKGLADYFSDTVPIVRISGGGDGAFGGDNLLSQEPLPASGENKERSGLTDEEGAFKKLAEELRVQTTQSEKIGVLREHIGTRITPEGLVIDIFALEGRPLFDSANRPTQTMRDLIGVVVEVIAGVTNALSIKGHAATTPHAYREDLTWKNTLIRAEATRKLMLTKGLNELRVQHLVGRGNRAPFVENALAIKNNRIEIILLRSVSRRNE